MSEDKPVDRLPADSNNTVARQLARAGARLRAPEAVEAQVRAAVESAWHETVQAQRRKTTRKVTVRWALAASIAALGIAALFYASNRAGLATPAVATVAATQGSVLMSAPGAGVEVIAPVGTALTNNSRLRVAVGGGVRIAMAGAMLTVDADSELEFDDRAVIHLQRGRIYVDGVTDSSAADRIRVLTPFGNVEHLGTRFEVVVRADGMRVRVRDGQVRVVNSGTQKTLFGSEEAALGSRGEWQTGFVAPFSAEWVWTEKLAPPYSIEGRTLTEFLNWFAERSGYALRFDTDTARRAAASALLHGSIDGLSARDALDAVMVTTKLRFELTPQGECRISERVGADTAAH